MPIPVSLKSYSHVFADTPLRFAGQLMLASPDSAPSIALAAALACHAQQQGHICVDLGNAEQFIKPVKGDQGVEPLPELSEWRNALNRSSVVSDGAESKPLILEGDRLYLGRYWFYENFVAERLNALASSSAPEVAMSPTNADPLDWQQVAVAVALKRRLAVISGGPGTGKTTTLVKILAALKTANPELDIALAAPTGKAAGRMQEAIQAAISALPNELQQQMPDTAVTLHRLLGVKHGSIYFRKNNTQPLGADIVVVDEASMVDLAMMAKLLDALKPTARLILLGDRDQLASVEAGSVLGDICALQGRDVEYSAAQSAWLDRLGLRVAISAGTSAIADSIVVLQKSYRFDDSSGIGHVARGINAGDFNATHTVLASDRFDDVQWRSVTRVAECLEEPVVAHWRRVMGSVDVVEALQAMTQFRVLLAVREGPFGVTQVNSLAIQQLRRANVLSIPVDAEFYAGQPIMILKNDPVTGLANGDVGLVWPDEAGELRFYCYIAGKLQSLSPVRLPSYETVFAMTVHKSQGSEFDEVLLILPDRPSPVTTRELLYTAVTRAKKKVVIAATKSVLESAVSTTVQRNSGLAERLRHA